MAAHTIAGTGVMPKIMRSLLHPLLVHQAIVHGWPMTSTQAFAEVEIGLTDLREVSNTDLAILGAAANNAIESWKTALGTIANSLLTNAQTTPDEPPATETKDLIQDHLQAGLDLLAALDADLVGITSDAGTAP